MINIKYFACSDIHGCFDQMLDALNRAGFDRYNKNHKLIVVGDAFDRGPQNRELADYLVELHDEGQLIYVLGNHDFFLMNYVAGDVAGAIWNAQQNGMKHTVAQLGDMPKEESWFNWLTRCRPRVAKHRIFEVLLASEMYFENDKFIYAHSGIPNFSYWRDMMDEEYSDMRTDFVFKADYEKVLNGKQLVVGHWHAYRLIAQESGIPKNEKNYDNHLTYISKDGQKIAIDGCVNYSGIVNVHVYEEGE